MEVRMIVALAIALAAAAPPAPAPTSPTPPTPPARDPKTEVIPPFAGAAPGSPGQEPFCATVGRLVTLARQPKPFEGLTGPPGLPTLTGAQGDCRAAAGSASCGVAYAYASSPATLKADLARVETLGQTLPELVNLCLTGDPARPGPPMVSPVGAWTASKREESAKDSPGFKETSILWTDASKVTVRVGLWSAHEKKAFVSAGLELHVETPPPPPEPEDTGDFGD